MFASLCIFQALQDTKHSVLCMYMCVYACVCVCVRVSACVCEYVCELQQCFSFQIPLLADTALVEVF